MNINNYDLVVWTSPSPRTTEGKSKRAKRDKCLDFARELKKLQNIKVIVIPIVIGAVEKVPNVFGRQLEELESGGQIEAIQTTALLRSVRILWKVLETWGDLISIRLQWKPIS